MARAKWGRKREQRLELRAEMTPQRRIVSDWLYGLMERRKLTNFSAVYQFFFKCAVECLPRKLLEDAEVPTASILGSWFRGESGINNKWLESIAYVRRCEEGLPEDFSGADVMLWIRTAPDVDIVPPDTADEPEDIPEESIVLTEEQIEALTREQTMAEIERLMVHLERLAAASASQNSELHKKVKK
jgi:hypothetical protein